MSENIYKELASTALANKAAAQMVGKKVDTIGVSALEIKKTVTQVDGNVQSIGAEVSEMVKSQTELVGAIVETKEQAGIIHVAVDESTENLKKLGATLDDFRENQLQYQAGVSEQVAENHQNVKKTASDIKALLENAVEHIDSLNLSVGIGNIHETLTKLEEKVEQMTFEAAQHYVTRGTQLERLEAATLRASSMVTNYQGTIDGFRRHLGTIEEQVADFNRRLEDVTNAPKVMETASLEDLFGDSVIKKEEDGKLEVNPEVEDDTPKVEDTVECPTASNTDEETQVAVDVKPKKKKFGLF